jgi:hypothetical protein
MNEPRADSGAETKWNVEEQKMKGLKGRMKKTVHLYVKARHPRGSSDDRVVLRYVQRTKNQFFFITPAVSTK